MKGNFARIVVVGANGAGKTWVATRLAAHTGAALVHKDALALTTGWVQRSRGDVQAQLLRLIASQTWVLDGGPSVLSPDVLRRATLIVWLDVPRGLRVWRIARRSLKYFGQTRPEHPQGNREWPGRRQFAFLWRAWRQDDRFRQDIADALGPVSQPVVRLTTRAEISEFIETAGQRAERL